MRKTGHLAHLNGRDGLGGEKELNFRHVLNSLREGKNLTGKIKRVFTDSYVCQTTRKAQVDRKKNG